MFFKYHEKLLHLSCTRRSMRSETSPKAFCWTKGQRNTSQYYLSTRAQRISCNTCTKKKKKCFWGKYSIEAVLFPHMWQMLIWIEYHKVFINKIHEWQNVRVLDKSTDSIKIAYSTFVGERSPPTKIWRIGLMWFVSFFHAFFKSLRLMLKIKRPLWDRQPV